MSLGSLLAWFVLCLKQKVRTNLPISAHTLSYSVQLLSTTSGVLYTHCLMDSSIHDDLHFQVRFLLGTHLQPS